MNTSKCPHCDDIFPDESFVNDFLEHLFRNHFDKCKIVENEELNKKFLEALDKQK